MIFNSKGAKVVVVILPRSASGLVTPEDFDLWSGNITALEFKLKNLSYIHSLNKTKQPFYNL